MNPDVADVKAELDAHRERFEAFSRSLSEEQLARAVPSSTWIVKDFISHLATIDGPVAEMFRTIHEGADPGRRTSDGAKFEVDGWNDRQVERRRERTLDEIFAEAAASRAVLHERMAALTDEDIHRVIPFGGDSKRPASKIELIQYLRGWCKQDPMHVVDMLRALPEMKTPDLDAWVDDPVIRGYQSAMNPGERHG